MNSHHRLIVGVATAVALFGVVNLLGTTLLSSARLDLTEESLYTLSPGAKAIARGLDETVHLEYYASNELRDESAQLQAFMRRVEDVLEEFVLASEGKLVLKRFDPERFSEAEDEAGAAGLQRIQLQQGGQEGYFGLVLRNTIGEKEVITTFNPAEETFLEYEIAQRLLALDDSSRPIVGLLTGLPVAGAPAAAPGQRPMPEWQVVTQLRRQFDVRTLVAGLSEIDADVDVLILLHPSGLPEATLYAIDQFALRGGKVLACVDPFCAVDTAAQQRGGQPEASDLGPLLAAWGVAFDREHFVADRELARVDEKGDTMLFAMRMPNTSVDTTDPVTAKLTDVELFTPGALEQAPGATTTFTPLMHTTASSALMSLLELRSGLDPQALMARFYPGDEELTIAARVRGPIKSAYPNGPAPAEGEAPTAPPAGHLEESTTDLQAIVIADADFVFDGLWMARTMFGLIKQRENADFLLNAVEQLSGNDALLSLRARGTFERPFERIQELRQAARERLRDEDERLEAELQERQARIDEIVREQRDGGTILLTPELEAELAKARAAELETREQLRQVQYDLKSDERRLGSRLELLNIGFVPLLVVVAGIATSLERRRRRRSAAASN